MSVNLNASQVATNQDQADVTINDATGRLDAAITEDLEILVDNTNAGTITAEEMRANVVFVISPDTPSPTATITFTVPAVKRGIFVLRNNTAEDVEVSISGQSEPVVTVAPSDTKALFSDGVDVRGPSAGGGVTDHGALTGLGDDDHTQYSLVTGTRAYTGPVTIAVAGVDIVINPLSSLVSRLDTDSDAWVFRVDVDGSVESLSFSDQSLNPGTDDAVDLGATGSRWNELRVGTGVSSFEGQVGIGTQTPATSAFLEVSTTTGAILVPRMNTTQQNALTAVNGMVIYNTTVPEFRFYQNGAWTGFTSTGSLDATYLRLDATNDPVTGQLDIGSTSSPISAAGAVRAYSTGAAANWALFASNQQNAASVDVAQFSGNRSGAAVNDEAYIGLALKNATAVDDLVRLGWRINSTTQNTRNGRFLLQVSNGANGFYEMMRASSDATVPTVTFNEAPASGFVFRIEGNTDPNLFYTNGTGDNIGIGTAVPGSAKLNITSTVSGLLIPRMSNTDRQNIIGPATSLMIYNSTNATFDMYQGATLLWRPIPVIVARANLTAQSAAITATTIYTVPNNGAGGNGGSGAEGMYRIAWVAAVTTAASTSSVLGGTAGFQVTYTDADSGVTKTTTVPVITDPGNNAGAGGTAINGEHIVNAAANTAIQYAFDYTSVGGTAMQYNLHIRVIPVS